MGYDDVLAAFRGGDNTGAAHLARDLLTEASTAGDAEGQVSALCMLSRVALREGDLDTVASRAVQAQQIARSVGDRRLERMPIHLQAVAARMAGRLDEGRDLYARSIAVNEALGEQTMAAAEHRNLAYLEVHAGNIARARELLGEAHDRFEQIDNPAMAAYLRFDQATLAALDHDMTTAAAHLRAAQALWREQGTIPDPDDAAEIAALEQALRQHR